MVKAWLRGLGVTIVLLSGLARAATVEYRLELSEATGQFDLFASASLDDNAGIAAYSVDLVGTIASLNHVSPFTSLAVNDQADEGSAGFSFLRSASGLPWVHASQDTITATPHILYGLGQAAGSFSQAGVNPLGVASSTSWTADLKIASGFYDPAAGPIRIDYASRRTQANVFRSTGSMAVVAADIFYDPRFAAAPPAPVVLPTLPPPVVPSLPSPLPQLPGPVPQLPDSAPQLPAGGPITAPPAVDPPAYSVEYRIEFGETPGEFKLFGASRGAGAGLAAFGVALTGPITSLNHLSPSASLVENVDHAEGSAGFTLLRSADGLTSVHGSQDTITGSGHLLYGLGQSAGSLADAGLTSLASTEGEAWDSDLLLATGTFDATLGMIGIDYSSITGANVFKSVGSSAVAAADIPYDSRYAFIPPTPEVIPSPPSLPVVDPLPIVDPLPPTIGPTPEPIIITIDEQPWLDPGVSEPPVVLPHDDLPQDELPQGEVIIPPADVIVIDEVTPPAYEPEIGQWTEPPMAFPHIWTYDPQLWEVPALVTIDDLLGRYLAVDGEGTLPLITHSLTNLYRFGTTFEDGVFTLATTDVHTMSDMVQAIHLRLNLGDADLAMTLFGSTAEQQIPEPSTAGLAITVILGAVGTARRRPR